MSRRRLRAPTWSLDGTRIAFFDTFDFPAVANTNALRILDPTTGAIVTVTAALPYGTASGVGNIGTDAWSLCWLSGGTRILFTIAGANWSSHLYVVAASGGQPVRVTMNGSGMEANVPCAR